MKQMLIVLLSLLSFSSMAQELTCLNKLLHFNRHSGIHNVSKEEWTDSKDQLDAVGAKEVLKHLINSKLMCKTDELTVRIDPVCTQVLADIPESNVCHTYTNLGYFFITKDGGKNINFIFSKDKRFADPTENL